MIGTSWRAIMRNEYKNSKRGKSRYFRNSNKIMIKWKKKKKVVGQSCRVRGRRMRKKVPGEMYPQPLIFKSIGRSKRCMSLLDHNKLPFTHVERNCRIFE